jgi:hypothetical protein
MKMFAIMEFANIHPTVLPVMISTAINATMTPTV